MCEKSKTVKWVDVSQPHQRKRRLIDHLKLVEPIQPIPSKETSLSRSILRDLICTTEYIKCGVDEHGNSQYRHLNKTTLPNHRIFNAKKDDESENYLFVPFCNEAELNEEGENAERAFKRHMANNSAHSEKLQKMPTESVQMINEARQAEEEMLIHSRNRTMAHR